MSLALLPGDTAPWFTARAIGGSPHYQFDQVAGRPVLLLFAGSMGHPASRDAFAALRPHRALFDDERACMFGITSDVADLERVRPEIPGIRWFLDESGAIARRYGALTDMAEGGTRYQPHWMLLDSMLRLVDRARLADLDRLLQRLRSLEAEPPVMAAPVLVVPRVFEPAFCRRLIDLYERQGGEESGFMRDVDGKTVGVVDRRSKRRSDVYVEDEALKEEVRTRLSRALLPMIERAFHFKATRIERYLVACYDAESGGFFRPHRDNLTHGTAHRRFACSINLNAEDHEGGELRFPEFGDRLYRPSTGGAVVFSCTLLHEATPVTRGRRYAYLPFLYDEAAARQREQKQDMVGEGLGGYRAEQPQPA